MINRVGFHLAIGTSEDSLFEKTRPNHNFVERPKWRCFQLTTERPACYSEGEGARTHQPESRRAKRGFVANRQTNGVVVRRKCPYPRCFNPAPCPRHPRDTRPSAHRRGYGRRWRMYRESYLRDHPLCVHCDKEGELSLATQVDHIQPVAGPNEPLFWDPTNHQPLCRSHHSQKTRAEMQTGRPVKTLGLLNWGPPRSFLRAVAKNENQGSRT